MSFITYIANGFRQLFWDAQATHSILKETHGFRYALILLCILSGFSALVTFAITVILLSLPGPELALSLPIMILLFITLFAGALLFSLLSYGVTHLVARLFGGKARFSALISAGVALSFALSVINLGTSLLSLIPLIGPLISFAIFVYGVIVYIRVVREVYELSNERAAGVVLIPLAVLFVLLFILVGGVILFAPFYV